MLHFTSRAEWEAAQASGQYRPYGMAADGFIHLSFGHQLARVAAERARGAPDLVILVVDPSGLESELRLEGGFPHLYGPIPVASVRLVADFPPNPDGSFEIPEQARLAELALTALRSENAALARARVVMEGFGGPWWIGGGWAVDAAAGAISRPHLDLDIIVLRADVRALGRQLEGWDLRLAHHGTLRHWDGRQLPADQFQVWGRPDDGFWPERWQDFAAHPEVVESLAEKVGADGRWVYRRDPAVRAPLQRLGAPGGFLSPAVALLYKATAAAGDDPVVSAKAQSDFDHVLLHLDRDQRDWLGEALTNAHPGHRWLSVLAG